MRSRASAGPAAGGFVLLEILIALVIFSTLVLAYARATDNALEAAAQANSDRVLRLLTCRKLSEIRAKPMEFIDGGEGGFEEQVDYGEENPFLDYRWTVEPGQEVTVAGQSDANDAVYLFDRDKDGPPAQPAGTTQTKPVPEILVRLVLTVARIPEGEGETEKMRAVAWVLPPPKDATQGGGH
jgi:prepilin-type N-terminal cleavage/methylation domain-containing protein